MDDREANEVETKWATLEDEHMFAAVDWVKLAQDSDSLNIVKNPSRQG